MHAGGLGLGGAVFGSTPSSGSPPPGGGGAGSASLLPSPSLGGVGAAGWVGGGGSGGVVRGAGAGLPAVNDRRVAVFNTGGTIGMRANAEGALEPSEGYLAERMARMEELQRPGAYWRGEGGGGGEGGVVHPSLSSMTKPTPHHPEPSLQRCPR